MRHVCLVVLGVRLRHLLYVAMADCALGVQDSRALITGASRGEGILRLLLLGRKSRGLLPEVVLDLLSDF